MKCVQIQDAIWEDMMHSSKYQVCRQITCTKDFCSYSRCVASSNMSCVHCADRIYFPICERRHCLIASHSFQRPMCYNSRSNTTWPILKFLLIFIKFKSNCSSTAAPVLLHLARGWGKGHDELPFIPNGEWEQNKCLWSMMVEEEVELTWQWPGQAGGVEIFYLALAEASSADPS